MYCQRIAIALCYILCPAWVAAQNEYASHSPPRPLPVASDRPRGDGPARFVDGRKGDDKAAGTEAAPWKTLQHAAAQLKPGDTLYLRGGTYYEHVTVTLQGTEAQPIVIRSFPGELVTIDGGLAEFAQSPETAWEPVTDGVAGEYRSTKSYPGLTTREDTTNALGNFGDSLIPLQGYRFLGDLRSDNPYWNVDSKVGGDSFVYCGPGLFFNRETERIHCRLAPTQLSGLGKDNYQGEADPRKLQLVVAAGSDHSPLTLRGCSNLKLQDLTLRGSVESALDIQDCQRIELSGLHVLGGYSAVRVVNVQGLAVLDTAVRGIAAPWTFRGSLKYRAVEARLFSANRWLPTGKESSDFDIRRCEFTDSVDGIFLGNVRRVNFTQNLVENISDDGLFLTSGTAFDGETSGGPHTIVQNRFSRILTTFAFGVGHGRQKILPEGRKATGERAEIAFNVFDFRRPVHYRWPNGPQDVQELNSFGRFAGDHGSPAWEPMEIVNNTILCVDPPRYDYLTDGLGRAMGHGTERLVANNIVCQSQGIPGPTLPDPQTDYLADYNLAWSLEDGDRLYGLFENYRKTAAYAATQKKSPAGWTTHDLFVDPLFVGYSKDWKQIADVRLKPGSPAVNSGEDLYPLPDGLVDQGKRDRGAIPLESKPWPVGVRGRWNVIGELKSASDWQPLLASRTEWNLDEQPRTPPTVVKRALVVQGYPAFDAPLLEFALRKQGTEVTSVEKTWIPPSEFKKYDLVAYDGSLIRAKITPASFTPDELKIVAQYLEEGGVLLLLRDRLQTDLFATNEGKFWLGEQLKLVKNSKAAEYEVLQPKHPWLAHLKDSAPASWLQTASNLPLSAEAGERIIGAGKTHSLLHRQIIGKGALIYVGFSPAAALPSGRAKETAQREAEYEAQYKILAAIVKEPLAK